MVACKRGLSLCVLGLMTGGAAAQWDENGMNPREEEYFGQRMRDHGRPGADVYQQPQRSAIHV